MQIRYFKGMQAMARTANSKIIFLPSASTVGSSIRMAKAFGEGAELQGGVSASQEFDSEF
jgi:erythrocyte band 7 integral membrane protein